ncbi:sensor histidine kinase [Algoriphagus sediminis]|uniref:Histidine kinase n=1 Tax=Algoriphagus sediminis TaxID=3057113 RepID=A0ABT7YGR1_9BACT|nr:histidine kinase [Algoriphagus sediminis]MDN3205713.1 histidine kinase [Algoriphagus sediminis]
MVLINLSIDSELPFVEGIGGFDDLLYVKDHKYPTFELERQPMEQINSQKRVSVLVHILGWATLSTVLLLLLPLSYRVDLPMAFWYKQLFLAFLLSLIFYANMLFMVPRILLQKKLGIYLITVLIGGVLFLGLLITFENLVHLPELMFKAFNPSEEYQPRGRWIFGDIFYILLYLLSIGVSTSVASVQKWQKDEALRIELDRQRIKTELSYLKAQINPHFFFNTLNNIYSLTNLDVSKAQEALLKLSRMMRYVLYENQKDLTSIQKEIGFINDYVELMKMRLSPKVKLKVEMEEPREDLLIAPMLLLPFLENCFKHGVSGQKESEILIKLEMMGKTLFFETRNQIFPLNPESPEAQENGIGLVNTRRRLDLLYPKKHKIKFGEDEANNEYWVNLTISLE